MNEDEQQMGSVFSFGAASPLDPANKSPHPGRTYAPIGDEIPTPNYEYVQRQGVTDAPAPLVTVGPGETLTPVVALRESTLPQTKLDYDRLHREWGNPRYLRTAQFWIPDPSDTLEIDFSVEFPVWSFVVMVVKSGTFAPPQNSIRYVGPGSAIFNGTTGYVNLPAPSNGILRFQPVISGAAVPPTGFAIWAYDSWIPAPGIVG